MGRICGGKWPVDVSDQDSSSDDLPTSINLKKDPDLKPRLSTDAAFQKAVPKHHCSYVYAIANEVKSVFFTTFSAYAFIFKGSLSLFLNTPQRHYCSLYVLTLLILPRSSHHTSGLKTICDCCPFYQLINITQQPTIILLIINNTTDFLCHL